MAAPVVSLCLVAVIGFGAWQSGLFKTETPIVPEQTGNVVSDGNNDAAQNNGDVLLDPNTQTEENQDEQIITGNYSGQKGAETGIANDACRFWWRNKLVMYGDLYWALDENPDGVFSVLARYSPTTGNITSFSYEGKTLAEWAIAAFEENASHESVESYKLAYNAYLETVLPAAASRLSESGIPCERAPYRQDCLIFTATAQEHEDLPLEDLQSWIFALASDELKGRQDIITDVTGLQVVN